MQKYKKLLLNIFIFGIGGAGQKVLAFLLIPLYTSFLSAEDYGTVDLLINIVQLFLPILNLSIHDAVLSYALDKKSDTNLICSIGARYNIVSICAFLGITLLFRYTVFFQIDGFYIGFVCSLYILNLCNLYLSIVAKVHNKIMLLTVAGLCNTLLYLVLNIIFLKYFLWGIKGYMFAYLAGLFVSVLILMIGLRVWNLIRRVYDKEISLQMRKFSCPLIFNQTAWWINNISDRYMLAWLGSVHLNGIYSMAYKIPNILSACQGIVTQAWSISAIEEHDDAEVSDYYSKVFNIYCFVLCMITSILLLINNKISIVLFKNDFYEARLYAPILLLAAIYSGCSYFLGSILIAEKESLIIMISTISGAVVNITLNATLIPFLYIYGAAIATMISNFIIMLYRFIVLYRRKCLKNSSLRQILYSILLLIQIIFCTQDNYLVQVCMLIMIIAINHNILIEIYAKGKEFIWQIQIKK